MANTTETREGSRTILYPRASMHISSMEGSTTIESVPGVTADVVREIGEMLMEAVNSPDEF